MAKLTRQNLILFGRDGTTSAFEQFGSRANGGSVATKDVPTIQGLSAWTTGIPAALVSGSKAPFMQDFNGLFYVLSYGLTYMLQEGIAEWDGSAIYFTNSIVKKTGTYELYGSLTDTNTGNALPSQVDNSNWKYLGDIRSLLSSSSTEPVGRISVFGGSTPPAGYLECNGAAISRVTYANLFAVTSTAFGGGDGSTSFNLPDLRAEFIRGWDNGRGIDPGRSFGSLQLDQFQLHWHQTRIQSGVGNANHGFGEPNVDGDVGSDNTVNNAAARDPMAAANGVPPRFGSETRPRNIALLPIIKY